MPHPSHPPLFDHPNNVSLWNILQPPVTFPLGPQHHCLACYSLHVRDQTNLFGMYDKIWFQNTWNSPWYTRVFRGTCSFTVTVYVWIRILLWVKGPVPRMSHNLNYFIALSNFLWRVCQAVKLSHVWLALLCWLNCSVFLSVKSNILSVFL
jgi:hypothetical protein